MGKLFFHTLLSLGILAAACSKPAEPASSKQSANRSATASANSKQLASAKPSPTKAAHIRTIPFPEGFGIEQARRIFLYPGEKPVLWVFGVNAWSYELDIESGRWTRLDQKFGPMAHATGDAITIDLRERQGSTVWLTNFHKGLLRYDPISGSTFTIPTRPDFGGNAVTTVVPDNDRIWIGTSGGLYYLRKGEKKPQPVDNISGFWVRSVDLDGNRLWINGQYILNKSDLSATQVSEWKDWPIDKVQTFHLIDQLKVMKGHTQQSPVLILDGNDKIIATLSEIPAMYVKKSEGALWLCGPTFATDIARFDLATRSITESYSKVHYITKLVEHGNDLLVLTYGKFGKLTRPTGELQTSPVATKDFLKVGDEIWLLTKHGIKIVGVSDIDALFEESLSYDQAVARLNEVTRGAYSKPMPERIRAAAQTFAITKKFPDIPGSHQYRYNLRSYLKAYDLNTIAAVKEFLKGDITPDEEAIALYLLTTATFNVGDPAGAIDYYTRFKSAHPDSEYLGWISEADLEKVRIADTKIRELKAQNPPADKRLWETGNIFYEAISVSWNTSEVGYNSTLAFKFFKELVEKHPSSQWADNAEFTMLSYNEGLSHEGGDNSWNLEAIKRYKAILTKHPDTELAPKIELQVGKLYFWSIYPYQANSHNHEQVKEPLELALQAAERVASNHKDTPEASEADKLIQEINKLSARISWRLEASANKSTYTKGEPVLIAFKLTNLRKIAADIQVPSGPELPHFTVKVTYHPGYRYTEPKFVKTLGKIDLTPTSITIDPGKSHDQKIDITHKARLEKFGRDIGRLVLDKPGKYKLTGFFPTGRLSSVRSKDFWIEIR